MADPDPEPRFHFLPLDSLHSRRGHGRLPLPAALNFLSAGFEQSQETIPSLICAVPSDPVQENAADTGEIANAICNSGVELASAKVIDRVSDECQDIGGVVESYVRGVGREHRRRTTPFDAAGASRPADGCRLFGVMKDADLLSGLGVGTTL